MAFTKTPAGAANNFTLTGTQFEDITSIINADGVTVVAEAGNDDVTIQNSTSSVTGYNMDMGGGNDRIQFIFDDSQGGPGRLAFQNGTISTGNGDDIVFADDAGDARPDRTATAAYSSIYSGAGNDLVRLYGAISSSVFAGADEDTVDLFSVDNVVNDRTDRFSGSNIQLGAGDDLLRIDTKETGVIDTTIQGGQGDDDFVSGDEGAFDYISGNWARTTVFGGAGDDEFFFANAQSTLYLVGGGDADTILSGFGNDTVTGNDGADLIFIDGGTNSVLGGAGIDTITIDGDGDNTVYGGYQADTITIGDGFAANGNNVVYGDDDTANAGADVITITGSGQNTVYGGDLGDTITLSTDGFSQVFAGNGRDFVTLDGLNDENGGGTIYLGAGHDVYTNTGVVSQDNVSIFGGAGFDLIDAGTAPFLIEGGTQGDRINVTGASGGIIVQADGDSMEATDVENVNNGAFMNVWDDGDVISYDDGVDTVTGFLTGTNFLNTTLGDLGLDENGDLFNAEGLAVNDGMATGRTYYLQGNWEFNSPAEVINNPDGSFTVDANGDDFLIVTQGNNGPITGNSNSLVLIDVGNINGLNDTTII